MAEAVGTLSWRARLRPPPHNSMLNFLSSQLMRGACAAALLVLCVPGMALAQDTIQAGSLKPLETLPSLGPQVAPAAPGIMPDLASPAAGQGPSVLAPPASGTLPTLGPLATLGATPEVPGAAMPAVPAPAAGQVPAAAQPAEKAAPPPLPTGGPQVITAPLAQGYLYVEPYETRFEALFDAASMFAWLSPDTPVPDMLSPEAQQDLAKKAAARAAAWCTLTSGDETPAVSSFQVSVIKGLPGNTLPLGEGEPVQISQAMLGFIWEFATPPAPADVVVRWKGWVNGRTTLPLRAFFGTQSETGEINATLNTYRWRNMDRLPRPAPLARVPQLERPAPLRVPVGGIVWVLGGLVFYTYLKIKNHRLPGGSLPYLVVWLLGAVLMSQLLIIPVEMGPGRPKVTEVAEAQRIVAPLLRNVYRAFDHRSESAVYDVLERSVEGELLRRLYLETMQALTLEGREGTRVNITEFQVTVDKVAPNPAGEGFIADCNWMARGNVGHWGHTHSRLNIYNARLTLQPVKDEWKLTGLEVQEVRRL